MARISNNRPPFPRYNRKFAPTEPKAGKLLNVIGYDQNSRIGGKLTFDHLIETTDIGDWKMSVFEAARTYAEA